MYVPIPAPTMKLFRAVPPGERHPGLLLDKFVVPGNQEQQKQTLDDVVGRNIDKADYHRALATRQKTLEAIGAVTFRTKTSGPLTLHLSRASALENAGISLHPIYGFTYLPGSGLKGMARAYAETVWLAAQPEHSRLLAWERIEKVFGWAPRSNAKKPWLPRGLPKRTKDDQAAIGQICFLDAWPAKNWPDLIVDVVNNHHSKYYQSSDNQNPPGDWDKPQLVYFLAIKTGTEFEFALHKRRGDVADELLDLARTWLIGALVHEGAGAKTGAGYGRFLLPEGVSAPQTSPARKVFETTLELVTPAFLAGAKQESLDCELRPATLRGLLRWWWRTMHAGFVDVATLRNLEAAVWGDTKAAGAVRIAVKPVGTIVPGPFDRSRIARESHLESPPNAKTTQGLTYLSYGMADGRPSRSVIPPESKWTLTLSVQTYARAKEEDRLGVSIDAIYFLEQAKAALWLLCEFGGIGSKARKGFGSLISPPDLAGWSIEKCLSTSAAFRAVLSEKQVITKDPPTSPSLAAVVGPITVPTPWKDVYFAVDQTGYSVQAFAQRLKHDESKKALGLPRKVEKAANRFHPGKHVYDRHASPVWIHFVKGDGGALSVRFLAFVAAELPSFNESKSFLERFINDTSTELRGRVDKFANRGTSAAIIATKPKLEANKLYRCRFLAEKNKKKGWQATPLDFPDLKYSILNQDAVPADTKAGDELEMIFAGAGFRIPKSGENPPSHRKSPGRHPRGRK